MDWISCYLVRIFLNTLSWFTRVQSSIRKHSESMWIYCNFVLINSIRLFDEPRKKYFSLHITIRHLESYTQTLYSQEAFVTSSECDFMKKNLHTACGIVQSKCRVYIWKVIVDVKHGDLYYNGVVTGAGHRKKLT